STSPGWPCCYRCTWRWPWPSAGAAEPGLPAAPAARRMRRMITPTPLPTCVVASAWYDGDGRRHDMSLEELGSCIAGDAPGFAWIGLYEPAREILLRLQDALGLHPLAVEDAGKAHQRPKVEAY